MFFKYQIFLVVREEIKVDIHLEHNEAFIFQSKLYQVYEHSIGLLMQQINHYLKIISMFMSDSEFNLNTSIDQSSSSPLSSSSSSSTLDPQATNKSSTGQNGKHIAESNKLNNLIDPDGHFFTILCHLRLFSHDAINRFLCKINDFRKVSSDTQHRILRNCEEKITMIILALILNPRYSFFHYILLFFIII